MVKQTNLEVYFSLLFDFFIVCLLTNTGGFLLLLELARRQDFSPSTFVLPLTLPASASGTKSSFPRDFFVLGIFQEHQVAGGAMLILEVVPWLDPSELD
jgi:hypothetical protein